LDEVYNIFASRVVKDFVDVSIRIVFAMTKLHIPSVRVILINNTISRRVFIG